MANVSPPSQPALREPPEHDGPPAPGAQAWATPESTPAAPPKKRSKAWILAPVVVVLGLVGGGYAWTRRGLESTDDAQVDGELIAVPSRVSGTVLAVHFVENQSVKEGELLVELDPAIPRAKVEQARAALANAEAALEAADADARLAKVNATGNKAVADAALTTASVGAVSASNQIAEAKSAVASAEATLKQANLDLDRDRALLASNAIPQTRFDRTSTAHDVAVANLDAARARYTSLKSAAAQAQSRVVEASAKAEQSSDVDTILKQAEARRKSAQAQVDSAKANLALAELDLSYTSIKAPHDGVLSKKTVSVGQTIALGQAVGQLVTPEVWITGNFKETQIEHMQPGETATFSVDAFPGTDFRGTVESFSGATGSRFALLPPDNASGNYTKVVQRVPVRIHVEANQGALALRPGMSVELTVDTRSVH